LDNNEIKIEKIKEDTLFGNYKNFSLNVKCLFKQGCYMILKNEIKEFRNKINKEEELVGFLVSNVYFSKEVIEEVENNNRIYLCHENELVDVIKSVEEYKCCSLKEVVEELEFLKDLRKEIDIREEKFLKKLKEFVF
jgi:hypothetical protein